MDDPPVRAASVGCDMGLGEWGSRARYKGVDDEGRTRNRCIADGWPPRVTRGQRTLEAPTTGVLAMPPCVSSSAPSPDKLSTPSGPASAVLEQALVSSAIDLEKKGLPSRGETVVGADARVPSGERQDRRNLDDALAGGAWHIPGAEFLRQSKCLVAPHANRRDGSLKDDFLPRRKSCSGGDVAFAQGKAKHVGIGYAVCQ